MKHVEVAEQIARDTGCAQGEFNQRVLSIIPYLTEHFDEIARLTAERDAWMRETDIGKAQIERLKAALTQIRGLNDNPAVFNPNIEPVLREALDEQ